MARVVPILLLAGGELFLVALGLRIALWALRGWHQSRALARGDAGRDPRPPGGGLRVLRGGGAAEAPGWRLAA